MRIGASLIIVASQFLSFAGIAATAPVVTEFAIPSTNSSAGSIAMGPGNVFMFIEASTNKIGRLTTDGSFTEFTIPTASSGASSITLGPDQAFWFTEANTNKIGRITNSGVITEFPVPTAVGDLVGISSAQGDNALWFIETVSNKIGRITTTGTYSEYAVPTTGAGLSSITQGPGDLMLWFTERSANKIGKITTSVGSTPGQITEYSVLTTNSGPNSIVGRSLDFALWFTEGNANKIGRIGEDGTITEFVIPTGSSGPSGIALGADEALWFTENLTGKIGRLIPGVVTDPVVTEYLPLTGNSAPLGISAGADNAIWFTENAANKIGRITRPTNSITVVTTGSGQGQVTGTSFAAVDQPGISCGGGSTTCSFNFSSGLQVNLFGTAASGSVFNGWSGGGCISTTPCSVEALTSDITVNADFGLIPVTAMLSVVDAGNGTGTVTSNPSGITCGATCNASFNKNTQVTLTPAATAGSTFIGWSGGGCSGILPCTVTLAQATTVTASFAADSTSDITLVSALLPTSRSVQVGSAATFFGTMINASTDTTATNCTVAPTNTVNATFSFQTTDSATNAVKGTANTPVDILPGAAQSFLLSLTPASAFNPTNVAFTFTCTNAAPAASNMGLNTLLLSASVTPTPDVVALAATVNNDGIVDIPGAGGTGAFAVATANVGAAGAITASANGGAANLPVTITICATDPSSGQCLSPPAASAFASVAAGGTPTFAIFVKGNGTVPFSPAANRIFVQFQDGGGVVRGSTSVAVRTQ